MTALALPVVVAELGWMAMGLVDTVMVGPLGAAAIGAVGLAGTLFLTIVIFGMGLLLGLDTLVSQSYGAGRIDECHRWLLHGVVLAAGVSAPTVIVALTTIPLLRHVGLHPEVLALTVPYLEALTWSAIPLLFYATFRRYLQAIGIVRPIMVALVSANIVNVIANWVLIWGYFGAPALGTTGSAWATVIARTYMTSYLLATIVVRERRMRTGLWQTPRVVEAARLRRLLALGGPAAAQLTTEIGVFAAATALAGRLEPASLAAHQIALNVASFTFMVPLGVASAGAVRVGHALGRGDAVAASRAGWTALLLGAAFMAAAGVGLFAAPAALIRVFTSEPEVIVVGTTLLIVAAVFQLFDGVQVVATGVLRGSGDTRTAMFLNVAGHWAIGLPLGYALCFWYSMEVVGLWVGLSVGLMVVGTVLLVVWARRMRSMIASSATSNRSPFR